MSRGVPWLVALVCALSPSVSAQITTLSQSVNNVTIVPGSVACAQGPPNSTTLENGYIRSYPLASLPGPIEVASVRFGVDFVSTPAATYPLEIRLFNDPDGGAPSPYSGLQLRHTETF